MLNLIVRTNPVQLFIHERKTTLSSATVNLLRYVQCVFMFGFTAAGVQSFSRVNCKLSV